jgi:Tol biopolymer transport system component
VKGPDAGPGGAFYRIPVLGGTPRKLLNGLDGQAVYSPDGQKMAYIRAAFPASDSSALMVANADGSDPHALATRKAPEFFAPLFYAAPTWSPDGSLIVAPMELRGGRVQARLVAVRAADGVEQPFPRHEFDAIGQVTWMPDGHGLVLAGVRGRAAGGTSGRQLWWVDDTSTSEQPITSDLFDYRKVSITADGTALVTVASDTTSGIWVVPIDGSSAPRRASNGKYDGINGLAALADGRILFRAVDFNLWSMNADGGARRQITTDGASSAPSVSADGRLVAYVSARSGRPALWTMTPDGENAREIAVGGEGLDPALAPDGTWMAYTSTRTGAPTLWRVAVSGGTPVQLTSAESARPTISPDGKRIALFYHDTATAYPLLAVMPAAKSAPVMVAGGTPLSTGSTIHWTPDGAALLQNSGPNDRANIWRIPVDGGTARPLTHFPDQIVFGFDVSADGRQLIVARGTLTRDAILIRHFR